MIHWIWFSITAFGAAIIGGLVTYFIFTSTFEELISSNLNEIHRELKILNRNSKDSKKCKTTNPNIKGLLQQRIQDHRDFMLPEITIGYPNISLIIKDSNRDDELNEALSREREDYWLANQLGIELDTEE